MTLKLKKSIAVSDSGFLFNAATGDSFTTNETGIDILQLIKEGKEIDEIVEYIVANYNTSPPNCEKDILEFISLLKQWHLVDTEGDSTP